MARTALRTGRRKSLTALLVAAHQSAGFCSDHNACGRDTRERRAGLIDHVARIIDDRGFDSRGADINSHIHESVCPADSAPLSDKKGTATISFEYPTMCQFARSYAVGKYFCL